MPKLEKRVYRVSNFTDENPLPHLSLERQAHQIKSTIDDFEGLFIDYGYRGNLVPVYTAKCICRRNTAENHGCRIGKRVSLRRIFTEARRQAVEAVRQEKAKGYSLYKRCDSISQFKHSQRLVFGRCGMELRHHRAFPVHLCAYVLRLCDGQKRGGCTSLL